MRWLGPIADALDSMHARELHLDRDIKPGNILFDGDGRPYLSDFGIAEGARSDGVRPDADRAVPRIAGTCRRRSVEGHIGKAYAVLLGAVVSVRDREPPPAFATPDRLAKAFAGRVPPSVAAAIRRAMAIDPWRVPLPDLRRLRTLSRRVVRHRGGTARGAGWGRRCGAGVGGHGHVRPRAVRRSRHPPHPRRPPPPRVSGRGPALPRGGGRRRPARLPARRGRAVGPAPCPGRRRAPRPPGPPARERPGPGTAETLVVEQPGAPEVRTREATFTVIGRVEGGPAGAPVLVNGRPATPGAGRAVLPRDRPRRGRKRDRRPDRRRPVAAVQGRPGTPGAGPRRPAHRAPRGDARELYRIEGTITDRNGPRLRINGGRSAPRRERPVHVDLPLREEGPNEAKFEVEHAFGNAATATASVTRGTRTNPVSGCPLCRRRWRETPSSCRARSARKAASSR